MIRLDDLSFRYDPGTRWVFERFEHAFAPGITLVKGVSGSGKSTLLRLCAGYLKPLAGAVRVPPRGAAPDREFQRRHLGYLFQKLNLLPGASLRHNMRMAAEIAGCPGNAITERMDRWAHHLGIEDLLDRRPEALSVGQQQRGAFARLLVKDPTVILLDEPTSGLDDANTDRFIAGLRALPGADRYCLIATHDSRLEVLDHHLFELDDRPC